MTHKASLLALCVTFAALTACNREPIKVNPPPPPDAYLVCEPMPEPPEIEPLKPYNTGDVKVYLKGDVDLRDSKIARWIVDVRGAWFSCATQLQAVRDYYAAQD